MTGDLIDIGALRRLLPARLRHGPAYALVVNPETVQLPADMVVMRPDAFLAEPPAHRLALVLVLDVLPELDLPTGQHLLGGLRDRWAEEVLILHRQRDTRWSLSAFLALGFRREPEAEAAAPAHAVYRTSLYDYKLTPDWLNARFWANPEMWDKARW